MNEPIYVAFSTQKGGAGKTTLTVLTASYLHYVKGYNVAVVDCDFPQYSIKDMRERDMTSATGMTITRLWLTSSSNACKKRHIP